MLRLATPPDINLAIGQIIGVAYTYRPSLAIRRHLTQNIQAYHSSQDSNFSYFYKGDPSTIVDHQYPLKLRVDPTTNRLARHWPEPELAALIGERNKILAYTLAVDLTAYVLETQGRKNDMDGTYIGKAWDGSGSLGPRFVLARECEELQHLTIGLKITRNGHIIYNHSYNTSQRLRPFTEIPHLIVSRYKQFGAKIPISKQILVEKSEYLPRGTVIMLGTGLIVPPHYNCLPGDCLTVYSSIIGELINPLRSDLIP